MEEKETPKKPTIVEIEQHMRENIRFPLPRPKRIVDMYSSEEIKDRITQFMQHHIAKGYNPSIDVIIEWLYSDKVFNERDDFVSITKLKDMVGKGQVFPLLIMEVLDYAEKVERAALSVNDELGHLGKYYKSIEELNKAIGIRLEVDEINSKKENEDERKR